MWIAQRILNIAHTIDEAIATDVAVSKHVDVRLEASNLCVERCAAGHFRQPFESEIGRGRQQIPTGEKV